MGFTRHNFLIPTKDRCFQPVLDLCHLNVLLKSHRSSVCDGRRRKCGCILSCPHCSPLQEVPKIQLSGPSIPIQSSAIRSVSVQQHIVSVSLESPGQDQDSCSLACLWQIRKILKWSQYRLALLRAVHLPGSDNQVADVLSRDLLCLYLTRRNVTEIKNLFSRSVLAKMSAASGGMETSPGGSTADLAAVWKGKGWPVCPRADHFIGSSPVHWVRMH